MLFAGRRRFRGAVGSLPGVAAALLLAGISAAPSFAQLQTKSQPAGMLNETGRSAGLCQCISVVNARVFHCLPSAAACAATCASSHYAFVPNATFSCGAATAQAREPGQRAQPSQAQPPQPKP